MSITENKNIPVEWQKSLYLKQSFPDNFFDQEKFLQKYDTIKNSNNRVNSKDIVLGVSLLMQQFTIIVICFIIYRSLRKQLISSVFVAIIEILLLMIGTFAYIFYCDVEFLSLMNNSPIIPTVTICGLCLRIVAPIIQTLTITFSEDTITTLAIIFSIIQLIFHDYAYFSGERDHFTGVLSLNAGITLGIILASRLNGPNTVFFYVLLTVILFSIYPEVSRIVNKKVVWFHIVIALAQWLLTSIILFFFDNVLFVLFEISCIFITFICPQVISKMVAAKESQRNVRTWNIIELQN